MYFCYYCLLLYRLIYLLGHFQTILSGEKIFEFRMVGKTFFKSFETKLFCIMLLMSVSAIIFKIYKYATLDIDFLKDCNPLDNEPGGKFNKLFNRYYDIIQIAIWLILYTGSVNLKIWFQLLFFYLGYHYTSSFPISHPWQFSQRHSVVPESMNF